MVQIVHLQESLEKTDRAFKDYAKENINDITQIKYNDKFAVINNHKHIFLSEKQFETWKMGKDYVLNGDWYHSNIKTGVFNGDN